MAMFGGFYKGEKKKKKKEVVKIASGVTPAFVPPKVIPKGKKEE